MIDEEPPAEPPHEVDDVPTISCSICDREWQLTYELDELRVGNRAVEQFALDHKRHTGHFPDEVMPWVVTCTECPDGEAYLEERPADRWAHAHARHARHTVIVEHESIDGDRTIEPPESDSLG